MSVKSITGFHEIKRFASKAGEAIEPYRLLQMDVDTDGNPVVKILSDITTFPIGISDSSFDEILKDSFETGDPINVNYDGIMPLEMSGIGSDEDAIVWDTGGKGKTQALPVSANAFIVGHALQDWTDGQIIPIKLNVNFQALAGSGGGTWSLDNTVLIDPDEDVIVGKRYKTIAAALIYVATQTPSITNRFTVLFGGTCSENIIVPSWVSISGIDISSILTGTLNSAGAAPTDTSEFNVSNCGVKNIILGTGEMITFNNCVIDSPTAPTSGYAIFVKSQIMQIDLTNVIVYLFQTSFFYFGYGNRTLNNIQSTIGRFEYVTVLSGDYKDIVFAGETYALTASCSFINCVLDNNMTVPSGVTVTMKNCTAKNITINAGGILNTTSVIAGTISNSGTWNNYGDEYDNSTSGLSATEFQSAMDEVVAKISSLPIYANNAAAVAGGLSVGDFYRTGGDPDTICVVH